MTVWFFKFSIADSHLSTTKKRHALVIIEIKREREIPIEVAGSLPTGDFIGTPLLILQIGKKTIQQF